LENALNEQINQMKANHSDYDEFQFQIDEIGHNPYQLISYLRLRMRFRRFSGNSMDYIRIQHEKP
jgi:hypothetical protein